MNFIKAVHQLVDEGSFLFWFPQIWGFPVFRAYPKRGDRRNQEGHADPILDRRTLAASLPLTELLSAKQTGTRGPRPRLVCHAPMLMRVAYTSYSGIIKGLPGRSCWV
jgi:hypothetical protein